MRELEIAERVATSVLAAAAKLDDFANSDKGTYDARSMLSELVPMLRTKLGGGVSKRGTGLLVGDDVAVEYGLYDHVRKFAVIRVKKLTLTPRGAVIPAMTKTVSVKFDASARLNKVVAEVVKVVNKMRG